MSFLNFHPRKLDRSSGQCLKVSIALALRVPVEHRSQISTCPQWLFEHYGALFVIGNLFHYYFEDSQACLVVPLISVQIHFVNRRVILTTTVYKYL